MAQSRNSEDSNQISKIECQLDEGYELIDFQDQKLTNNLYRVIALNKQKVLGRGSYGNVYKAYPVDLDTGKLIKNKKLAVKIFKGSHDVKPNEARFFDYYYAGCELISKNNVQYMVMACLPGENIMVNQKRGAFLNVELRQFDFMKRVDLIYNIMLAINLIHHNTPSTGSALIHGDINGSNIKVYYDAETEKIDVHIIDFGLSEEIDDDPDKTNPAQMEGAPLFMPSELFERELHGVKSDIYSLTPIFAAVLGASDPFALKLQRRYYEPEYYKTPYDFTGMFQGYVMPDFPFDLKSYIVKFLNRMQDNNLEKRPDSDEALRFFTTLNKMCKAMQIGGSDDVVYACGAKLAILADGLWKDAEFNKDVYESGNEDIFSPVAGKQMTAPEHYDFDDPVELATAKSIVAVASKTPLNSPILKKLMSKESILPSKQTATLFAKPSYLGGAEAGEEANMGSRIKPE